jgi:hypothetical protein
MTNRFMISVAAAALIAGTGFANAQGTGMGREAPSAGPTVQESAPPSGNSAAPANRDAKESTGPSSDMKASQSEQKSPGAAKNQRAQDDMKAGPKGEKSAQDNNMKGEKSKSMSSENDNAKGGSKEMKAQGSEDRSNMSAQGREDRNGTMNAETKGADSKSQTTVGQAGANAKLSTEQRTRITTVIRSQNVAPVEHVNFAISIGTRVPHDVRFYPLPTEVVTLYPEWRGYEFILVGDQIVVVDPRTLEIVAVLEA